MGFSRQEYWSGLPFPSPGDLPDPGIEPGSPSLWADSLPSEPPGKPNFSKLDAPYFLFQVSLLHIVMLFGPGCTNALGSTYILFPDAM